MKRPGHFCAPDNDTFTRYPRLESICHYFIGDVLGSVCVHQGVPALLPVHVRGADVGDHHGVTVAVQGVLQQPGKYSSFQSFNSKIIIHTLQIM